MKIEITIECDTVAEFVAHLTELRRQVKSKIRKEKLSHNDEFSDAIGLDDDNCYGTHEVEVIYTEI